MIKQIRIRDRKLSYWLAEESLGSSLKIGIGNTEAIAFLINIIRTSDREDTRRQAARSLGLIDSGNSEAIAFLINLTSTSESADVCREAANILKEIMQDDQMAGVVTAFKANLSNETWEINRD
ncbi:HEAT repeat domain-containing protein [Synechocystis sp. PCC 7509]|uniref:HEAT repeat domain-containing protein n=1 Tax=Synechocystis sp. PCC 7509 TaxID=927677 RepID=UPI0002AD0746|nr:HEAT repeat domain-containing protein [Synechocystis sp. PCC 7509]